VNSTNRKRIVEALDVLENERGIAKDLVIDALKEALEKAYKRNYLSNEATVKVEINPSNFEITIREFRSVVDDVNDEDLEISIEEAKAINAKFNVGDVVETVVSPNLFGRLAASQTKQILRQKIREAEKESLYNEYADKKDEIITGIIERVEPRFSIINIGRTGALLPLKEQVPSEKLVEGAHIKVYVNEVENSSKGTHVVVSRVAPGLVKRLFELEVPEIYDGSVEIVSVSREAGDRSKIAVSARNENIDPIGACVGPKGTRVRNVVDELHGEMIDIVEYSKDAKVYITNALAPANVESVIINSDNNATVIVPDNQLSLAIGKKGQNARLAVRLTGWKIDIKSYSEAISEGIDIYQADDVYFDIQEAEEIVDDTIDVEDDVFDDVEEVVEIAIEEEDETPRKVEEEEEVDSIEEVIFNQVPEVKEEIIDAKPKKKKKAKKEEVIDERVVEQILSGDTINIAELLDDRTDVIKEEDYLNYEEDHSYYNQYEDEDDIDYDEYDSYYDQD